MKKYLKKFSIGDDGVKDLVESISKTLEKRKITVEDIVSITTHNPGVFRKYTIWYKSEKK